jgi:hypothetical protein
MCRKTRNEYPLISEVGARFDLAHSKQLLLVGYRFRHNDYTKHGWGGYTEHEAELLGDFRLDSVFIKLEDSYANLFEPTGMYWNTKARRQEIKSSFAVGLDLNKLYAEVSCRLRSYHFFKEAYDPKLEIYFPELGSTYDPMKNRQTIISGEMGYNYTPKTRFSLKFDLGSVEYIEKIQNDYTYTSIFLGVDYRVTNKVKSFLYLGLTSQSVNVKYNPQTKEFSGLTASGSLAYRIAPKMTLNVTLLRELQYNAYVNYVVVTKVQAIARYQWTQKIRVSARLTFEHSKPSEKTAQVAPSSRIVGGLSARYDFTRWMAVGLDLEAASRTSSLDTFRYSNNIVSVFVTVHF